MPNFDKLVKNKTVANHPLLAGYRNLPNVRKAIEKHAQDLQKEDFNDILSLREEHGEKPRNINEMIYEASSFL